jgi:hypothetical protein
MKSTLLFAAMAAATALSACAPTGADDLPHDVATTLVANRLETRGKLCLWGPSVWPLDISKATLALDSSKRPKIIRQLEALQKVGLVESHDGLAWELRGDQYVKSSEPVVRYSVTDFGRHFLRALPSSAAEQAAGIEHGDLCYATMALDKVDDVSVPRNADRYRVATVSFTYKTPIVVPWVKDPSIAQAYPATIKALDGSEKTSAQMPLVKVNERWQVFEPAASTDMYHVRH